VPRDRLFIIGVVGPALALLAACATGTGERPGCAGVDDDVTAIVRRGEGRQALACYEARVGVLEAAGRAALDVARTHVAAARVAELIGSYQKGLRHAGRALSLLGAPMPGLDVLLVRTQALLARGNIYLHLNDLGDAERDFAEVLAGADRLPGIARLPSATLAGINLASVAALRGDHARVVESGSAAIGTGEELLALANRSVDRPALDRVIMQARELVIADLARALLTVGRAHQELGQVREARRSFERGLDYARRAQAAHLAALGRFFLAEVTGSDAEAGAALEAATRAGLSAVTTLMLVRLGARAAAAGRDREALDAFARASRHVEETRSELEEAGLRGLFVENKGEIYEGAVRAALALGRPDEAFAYAERGRARAFLDLLGSQTILSRAKARGRGEEERRLRDQLAEVRAIATGPGAGGAGRVAGGGGTRDVALAEYRVFLDQVRRDDPEQASLMTVEPVTLRDIQALLAPGTVLLEYLVTEHETILWLVEPADVRVLRLPAGRRALGAEVGRLRRAIAGGGTVDAVAADLSDRLLGPARAFLAGRRLLIVPHDVLHYVPFAALRTAAGRWLVEDHAITTVPSASVLKFLAGKAPAGRSGAVVVGNPAAGPGLGLPWAEREARAVGARYPDATVLLREAATESRIKALAPEAALLHFASHGELRQDDPLASALLLVPDGRDDGRLEVREIFGLDLGARLVVLSACETGLGRLSRGDELVGLQRAFLYAGTPAVVTTLWKVDDEASFYLMREFHAALAGRGPADALREAQRRTMREFPHPFFWAAFGFTGAHTAPGGSRP
jgi:CHAT domain-containing protein/tetratricopeptide (TPR) repeat protein